MNSNSSLPHCSIKWSQLFLFPVYAFTVLCTYAASQNSPQSAPQSLENSLLEERAVSGGSLAPAGFFRSARSMTNLQLNMFLDGLSFSENICKDGLGEK